MTWEKQVEQKTQYVGRGRGSVSREKRVIEKTRYHITHIVRQQDKIAALSQRFGWKAFVTNAGHTQLSLQHAVVCYRNEYRVERIFNRLKSRVHIAPLFVKCNDQLEGLTYLLTLGVRVLTVTEFVLRRSLETEQASLPGLHPENKHKRTDKPTAERILESVYGRIADNYPACDRRGNPAATDTPVSGTEGYPATSGVGGFTLRAA